MTCRGLDQWVSLLLQSPWQLGGEGNGLWAAWLLSAALRDTGLCSLLLAPSWSVLRHVYQAQMVLGEGRQKVSPFQVCGSLCKISIGFMIKPKQKSLPV
jgi:hypothetical protein